MVMSTVAGAAAQTVLPVLQQALQSLTKPVTDGLNQGACSIGKSIGNVCNRAGGAVGNAINQFTNGLNFLNGGQQGSCSFGGNSKTSSCKF